MPNRSNSQQQGFTLVELMVVCIVIMIIVAILFPSISFYIQTSRQTSAVTTANNIGNACNNWVLASGGSASLTNPVECLADYPQQMTREEVAVVLTPTFIKYIPEFDPWGNPWEYNFAGTVIGPKVFCLRSPGRDGVFDTDTYTIGPFVATDFDQDVVWADGSLVRWPQ